HESLPDLSLADIDLSTTLLGKPLRAPIVIAGMTGGTEEAAAVNRELASIAEQRGYGFGLGSQRAMHQRPEAAWTYQVRDRAPDTLVFGNLGVIQARTMPTSEVQHLVDAVGADALCLHMNPAMELIQPGGDRDFRGGAETFARLCAELTVPVIAKETGSGIGLETAERLRDAGVRTVDVSGAGGTSWVGVETLRAEGTAARLGDAFWDWGIPTAASILLTRRAGLDVIATGGIASGMDVARAIALGAHAAGIARGVYKALAAGGASAVHTLLDDIEEQLRTTMLLTGSPTVAELRLTTHVITGELREWKRDLG
ncbi:MAG: type 2 isopentenyl-diphosphate Delta-isomerase, partial [Myxococcales bacterium]|nr:type 2 isopentenyl-diphosphate Delta-isomerase [Myxococcales bacterium]